jgi:hypothetical protein
VQFGRQSFAFLEGVISYVEDNIDDLIELTVSAGLNGDLNIADALHCDSVLVIPVDKLILKLTHLIHQDAKFVGDVGNVVIPGFTPDRELLLPESAKR